MTIKELIDTYRISEAKNNAICVNDAKRMTRDNAAAEIKAKKPEILAYLVAEREAREAAYADRQRRIAEIEGLAEIKAAQDEMAAWRYKFNASFEGENAVGGLGVGAAPEHDIAALKAKYPRAAAYLRAEEYAYKANYDLSSIGHKALETVIYGDYAEAMRIMDAELAENNNRHMWD